MNETPVATPDPMTPIFNMDNPKTRAFLRMLDGAKKAPFHVNDFLDDRIPAMKTTDVDMTGLSGKPNAIHNDDEMLGAWRFMQMTLQRADLGAMTPLEIVELYRSTNDCGKKMRELNSLKRDIKEIKHAINKGKSPDLELELQNALEKKKEMESAIAHTAQIPHSQRVTLTQAVLIIGFLKEYISLRAVRVENAEEYNVYVPIISNEQIFITVDETQKLVTIKGTGNPMIFYASPTEAVRRGQQATMFIPIQKKAFEKDLRYGDDMINYLKILVKKDEEITRGYLEDPITLDAVKKIIEEEDKAKENPTEPLIKETESVEKEEVPVATAEEVQNIQPTQEVQ